MTKDLDKLIAAREEAMTKVRVWWDTQALNGNLPNSPTEAPAWPQYLTACAALDEAREDR